MAKQQPSRLENLKQLRAEELASSHPSHSYIQDLDQSIIEAERNFNLVKWHPISQMIIKGLAQ